MTQPETFQPSWLFFDNVMSPVLDADMGHGELLSCLPMQECNDINPELSFSIPVLENMVSNKSVDFQVHCSELYASLPLDDSSRDFEELDAILNCENIDLSGFLADNEENIPSQPLEKEEKWRLCRSMQTNGTLIDATAVQPMLIVPTEAMEFDYQLIVLNLFMAYGDAMENEQRELADVIVKRMTERVNPVGGLMERVLYYLFQPLDKQSEYLKQESLKNFLPAFMAFYQIFPYGKFAHLAANSAILEAIPRHAEIIHIVDFDIGDGIQWSSMIEAIGCEQRELRLTAIKWGNGDSWRDPCEWNFEETKRRLYDHARAFGQKLKLDELELRELSQIKKMRRVDEKEWFAFNCMVNLPHMARVRRRKDVKEFFRVAKELASNSVISNSVMTHGDGDASEKVRRSMSFGSLLDGNMVHYQALLESMECNFPVDLEEARTAMECLFVAPFVSSLAWLRKWEEEKESDDHHQQGLASEGWRVSKESLIEAKIMVREGESQYRVRVEGDYKNEMVLEWRNSPLVRVSSWRSS